MSLMTSPSLPGNFTFEQWANDLNNTLGGKTVPVPSKDPAKWRDWVYQFISSNANVSITLPTQFLFPTDDDWRKWAYFFITDINNARSN